MIEGGREGRKGKVEREEMEGGRRKGGEERKRR